MCYSAMVRSDYEKFVREYGAKLSLKNFYDTFYRRLGDKSILVPRSVEAAFESPQSDDEREIKKVIAQYAADREKALLADLEKQRERLAKATEKLRVKFTKTAASEQRIAAKKIPWYEEKLAELHRTRLNAIDSRIFPGSYVPLMVMEDGQRVLKMMRYHCRPAHVPATFDKEFPGCYNARKDSLKGFWRHQYGHTHGVLIIRRFYEHVPKHLAEQRGELEPGEKPETVVVEFQPEPPQHLAVACIWARWSAPGESDLYSFAIITDDPPPEILAVGHDRCVVPIRHSDIDTWLQPDKFTYEQLNAVLDPAARPMFRHSLVTGGERNPVL